ncbi:MAG: GNAT family N-acetyltransferase [Dehalococcoidia bacterium]
MISPSDEVVARGRLVIVRRKRLADAANEYGWRSDQELARYDAAAVVRVTFADFYRNWVVQLRFTDMGQRSFAVEDARGRHIGNVMYYNLDPEQQQAELGICIGEKRFWAHGYGSDAVATMVRYVFSRTSLRRLYLHTLEWNLRAQRCFSKAGFEPCATSWRDGETFVVMDVWRERVVAAREVSRALVR